MEARVDGVSTPAPAATDQREIEWQFDAGDLDAVAAWLMARAAFSAPQFRGEIDPLHQTSATSAESAEGQDESCQPASRSHSSAIPPSIGGEGGAVSLAPEPVRVLIDTYLDTPDWRVYRAGFALRVRRKGERGEVTLKSLESGAGEWRDRRELTEPLAGAPEEISRLPGPCGAVVRALAGTHPLRPLFEVHTHRRPFTLRATDGSALGEVVLDDTTIPRPPPDPPLRLQRVEVEAEPDGLALVQEFVAAFAAGCGLRPAGLAKFGAGLSAWGLTPAGPSLPGEDEPRAEMTAGEAAFAVLRRHLAALLAHEPGTRLGEDPEALHDMRVATRRLRAALSLFAGVLPPYAGRLRDELGWLGRALGEVRDLDVQIERVRSLAAEEPALTPLLMVYQARREAARARMLRALDSRRYGRLVVVFTGMLGRGPAQRGTATVPILVMAPDLIRIRHQKVRKALRRLTPAAPPEAFHRLRIRCKRLRYAVEFVAPLFGEPATAFVRRLVRAQDRLGQHQDAQVAIQQLRALSADRRLRLPPETVFAMGQAAERHAHEAEELRHAFPPVGARLTGGRWRRLRRAMDGARLAAWRSPAANRRVSPSE